MKSFYRLPLNLAFYYAHRKSAINQNLLTKWQISMAKKVYLLPTPPNQNYIQPLPPQIEIPTSQTTPTLQIEIPRNLPPPNWNILSPPFPPILIGFQPVTS